MAVQLKRNASISTKLKYSAIITLVLLFVLVMIMEIVLRVRCTFCSWKERIRGHYVSPYEEPLENTWYYLRIPNDHTSYKEPEFDYAIDTNSLGIRDVEHPLQKQPNEFRIIGMGDSFTEGVGVPYDRSYLKILERKLKGRYEGKLIRTINGGVSGSDPFYEYVLLRDKLSRYQPNLVMVTIAINDVSDVIVRGGMERFLENGKVEFVKPPAILNLVSHCHFMRFLFDLKRIDPYLGLSREEKILKKQEAEEKLVTAVAAFQQLAEKQNFRLLVILLPTMWEEVLQQKLMFDSEPIVRFLQNHGIDYVELMPAFTKSVKLEEAEVRKLFWEMDRHYKAQGYEIFADGVAEYILDHHLIDEIRAVA